MVKVIPVGGINQAQAVEALREGRRLHKMLRTFVSVPVSVGDGLECAYSTRVALAP